MERGRGNRGFISFWEKLFDMDAGMNYRMTFSWLGAQQWEDYIQLFGERGACGGCWCMYWRTTHKNFESGKGEANKEKIKQMVLDEKPLGILGYIGGKPVAWCALSPREDLVRLRTSRILKPVDDQAVWSIPCFYIDKDFRRQGISLQMLNAVVDLAREKDIPILEAYPVEASDKKQADVFMYTGIASVFLKAGFREVERRSGTRPIMRKYLKK